MPSQQLTNQTVQRNAALVEAMLLSAIADGDLSQRELQALLARVIERPEFEGTSSAALKALVEGRAKALASAKDLDEVLRSLRVRLPDHKNRMLAFGLAAAVAFSDQRATRAELGLLKTFQAALGISEDEVAQIIDVIEQGGSLSEALGEPVERLFAEVMVLVTVADGALSGAEVAELVANLSSDPVFGGLSREHAQGFVSDAVAALATEGLPARLSALAAGLTSPAQRLKAFSLAARVASAGGSIRPGEGRVLDLLQATFGLADDEVARVKRGS